MDAIKQRKLGLKDTEDPEVLNKIETFSRAIASNTEGIEGVYHKLFEIVGAVITCIYSNDFKPIHFIISAI